jgi:hypothetical protein
VAFSALVEINVPALALSTCQFTDAVGIGLLKLSLTTAVKDVVAFGRDEMESGSMVTVTGKPGVTFRVVVLIAVVAPYSARIVRNPVALLVNVAVRLEVVTIEPEPLMTVQVT